MATWCTQRRLLSGIVALLLAVLAAPAVANAQGRCDSALIERGLTFYEVEERCGVPVFEYSRTDYRYPGIFVQVDEWVYEFGRNKFRRQLTFEDGRLRRIETRAKPRREAAVRRSAGGRTVIEPLVSFPGRGLSYRRLDPGPR
ncbi:MAG: DUF2845 domain-containing protein [Pseudomonadota bacterium]